MRKSGPPLGKTIILLASATLLASSATMANAQSGTVKVKLDRIFGLKQTGSPDPSKDKACKERFGKLLQTVTTSYNINPHTLMMSAQSDFDGKTYNLSAQGLSNKYAFGYYQQPTGQPPIYAVLFSISKTFTHPQSQVVLQLDSQTNCLLTSGTSAPAMTKLSN